MTVPRRDERNPDNDSIACIAHPLFSLWGFCVGYFFWGGQQGLDF